MIYYTVYSIWEVRSLIVVLIHSCMRTKDTDSCFDLQFFLELKILIVVLLTQDAPWPVFILTCPASVCR